MKKRLGFFAGLLLALTVMAAMTIAAMADEYDYQVTVDGGLHGTVAGGTDTFNYNDRDDENKWFNPNNYEVTVTDSKYYFKGFHISGQEGVLTGAMPITKDMDFVATYGIKGDMVKYTAEYVDEAGAELAPSRTLYGNVGDEIVVAFVYVEGYEPDNPNITLTLDEDEDNNVATFVYHEVQPTVVPDNGDNGGDNGGQGGNNPGGGGNNPPDGGGNNPPDGGGNNPDGGGNNPDDGQIDDDDTPLGPGGETIPDDNTPLTPTSPEPAHPTNTALPWILGGVGVVVVAGIIVGVVLGKRKKKQD